MLDTDNSIHQLKPQEFNILNISTGFTRSSAHNYWNFIPL
jgi:hypothetical protein